MVEGVVFGIGAFSYLEFFIADFFMAYVLYVFKRDHPQIDEYAPAVPQPLGGGIGDDDSENRPLTGAGPTSISGPLSSSSSAIQTWIPSADVMHNVAIVASVGAPFFFFLQLVSPMGMSWSLFYVPEWLSFLAIVPALCLGTFYALRVMKAHQVHEVSKAQWLALMWFRLDVIFVMATLMLAGWGDWLVSLCLYALDFYLAHRLLVTERRLVTSTQGGHLLREEMDHRREVPPGIKVAASTSAM